MERAVSSMNGRRGCGAVVWRWIGAAVVGGVLACSAQQKPDAGSHGIDTPLAAERPRAAPSPSTPQSGAALELEHFSPLLLSERFGEAARARLEERHEEALSLYLAAIDAGPSALRRDPLHTLQLARLQEAAGKLTDAVQSYAAAAQSEWELSGYAAYFAGRAALTGGDARRSLEWLQRVPSDHALPVKLHSGEAHALLGERRSGIEDLRQFLGSGEHPNGWVRAALTLARLLSRGEAGKPAPEADRLEALRLVRRVAIETAGNDSAADAAELEREVLAGLTPEQFAAHQPLSVEDQLVRLQALSDARRHDDVLVAADELLANLGRERRFSQMACEARVLRNKALAARRKWGEAVDHFDDVIRHCVDPDLRARALFLAGRYALSDKRYAQATRLYAQLEQEAPGHRLADDARLAGAQAFLELGDAARFTSMLSTIVEDYPAGDLALDGAFELALRQIEKGDWSAAANVLGRGLSVAKRADTTREHEYAGRERYFLARAWIETGEVERGLAEYAALIRERPLSYYMQLAYSRLRAEDPARAKAALDEAWAATEAEPFAFQWRPEFEAPAFARALQLLRLGEVELAAAEVDGMGAAGEKAAPGLLWAVALLYDRAGSAHLSQQLLRGRLTDWLSRWPAGDWRKAWELAFPRPYHPIVQRETAKQGVPEALVYGVMREESVFDPRAVSHADAYGLMQLIEPTARHFGKALGMKVTRSRLLLPRVNIALGSKVLRSYSDKFPDNPVLGIPAYNAGPGRPKRWLKERPNLPFDVWVELIPFRETRRYTKRVLASRGAYTVLYDGLDGDWAPPIELRPRGG